MFPIRAGPLAGYRWVAVSGSRFLAGMYEPYTAAALLMYVREGDVVYDVGAHVGYFAAIARVRTGSGGLVIAFEPRPANARLLQRNMRANQLDRVRVVQAAVGDRNGVDRFEDRTGAGTGRLAANGRLEVTVLTLDDFAASGDVPLPDLIKVDVEGGELAVLEGAGDLVARCQPRILLATHSRDLYSRCAEWLRERGYALEILNPDQNHGETEILALPRMPPSSGLTPHLRADSGKQ